MIPYFPCDVLRETALSWQPVRRTISSGQTGSGFEPMAETTGGGLWSAELSSVRIRTPQEVKCWRAIEGIADSGATQIVVGL